MVSVVKIPGANGKTADLQITKIFWNAAAKVRSMQITLACNYGGQNMGILNRLVEVAQKDFPVANLKAESVNAVVLGGPSRRGLWGIEFHVPATVPVPKDYAEQTSELILGGGF